MEWIINNWILLLIAALCIGMYFFGYGCNAHGRHGKHGKDECDEHKSTDEGKDKEKGCDPLLGKARDNLFKAAALIKTFFDIFKGKLLNKQETTLSPIIAEAVDTVTAPADLALSYEFNYSDNHLAIHGDKIRLTEVFANLLQNAVEAMTGREEGKISIRAEDFTPGPENNLRLREKRFVKISIRDEGKGIPEENIDKLFIPYFSTKDTPTKKGLGLGLTTCYSIIKNHDGHIEINSQEGNGTTVHIYLPALEP